MNNEYCRKCGVSYDSDYQSCGCKSESSHSYRSILTDHDWLQIECAAGGGVSGTSDEWPDLVKAIEKVRNRKLLRQPAAWLRGFCEALILLREHQR